MTELLTSDVDEAVTALRSGGLVALPTETVYGLAALARRPEAVARIFAAKGRPLDHPVIVHLPEASYLDDWAVAVPDWARRLGDSCWPGPLTLILRKGRDVGDYLTGGQSTIGLRVPAHPLAHEVLNRLQQAVAAPSANRFGRVSPTSAQDVYRDLGEFLDPATDRVLDGGLCPIGVESTIVDASGDAPRLLRPGSVTADQIADVTGLHLSNEGPVVRAPGTLASHYAPRCPVVLATREDVQATIARALETHSTGAIGLIGLADDQVHQTERVQWLLGAATADELARGLYSALRRADDQAMSAVIAILPPDTGLGRAVADRLRRAGGPRTESGPS